MKISFLFWNLRGGERNDLLASLRRFAQRNIDIFVFAEGPPDPNNTLKALNDADGPYIRAASKNNRLLFFSLPNITWTDRVVDLVGNRIAAQQFRVAGTTGILAKGILLVGAHLKSPQSIPTPSGRAAWARGVARDIRLVERDVGHKRTILVGDLNMNPFDGGLIEADALHAVMTRNLARSVQGLESRHELTPFYNPMWSYFGDCPTHARATNPRATRPAGTYFFPKTDDLVNHFWNMYDQVLLRPLLMDSLVGLEILASDGQESLVTNEGRPRGRSVSDHLPIFFELDL